MTSIIKFTAISGVDERRPLCYLLQIDEAHILLDCGWNEELREEDLESIGRYAPQIDAVLVSHPDLLHLGALPYLIRNGLSCSIYATIPVHRMGQMFLYDVWMAHAESQGDEAKIPFSLDDIDHAFERFVLLKYQQRSTINSPKATGITITPFAAGHTLGGAVWRISSEEEDIIYAVDYNHQNERHLNGTGKDFSGLANKSEQKRPSLLITDSFNAAKEPEPRKDRDKAFLESVIETLRGGGNVLIPVDTAGRLLELTQVLDKQWSQTSVYPIVVLSHVATTVINFAMSQIEFMSSKMISDFETTRANPFKFKHIQMCQKLEELNALPKPLVVLASLEGMSKGFSLSLFQQWASQPNNLVLLTNRAPSGEIGQKLVDGERFISFQMTKRVPLSGAELDDYMRQQEEEEQRAALEADDQDEENSAGGVNRASESDGDGSGSGSGNGAAPMAIDGDAAKPARQRKSSMSSRSLGSASAGSKMDVDGDAGRLDANNNDDDDDDDDDDDEIKILRAKYVVTTGTIQAGSKTKASAASSRLRFKRDIYVLGDESLLSKRGSFFKQTRTFPMFPFVEHRRRMDEWGEPIRRSDYQILSQEFTDTLSKPQQPQQPIPADLFPSAADSMDTSKAIVPLLDSVDSKKLRSLLKRTYENMPCKTIVENVHLNVICKVKFVDLEGRSDSVSVKNITENINPRQMIIVHGSKAASRDLQSYLSKNASIKIYVAEAGECIDASSEHNIYQVKLRDPLMTSLRFSKIGAYELAYFHGQIHKTSDDVVAMPELDIVPSHEIPPHKQVFVGDPKLFDLKEVLVQAGFQAEFVQGVLVCNETVAIRKHENSFAMEGALSEEYFAIREILYTQFAIV